ncbi:MAG: hypothetical protein GX801_01525 [Fibrobacter sp.]|nr:hypothetical protein [Fibrobacter sp.]
MFKVRTTLYAVLLITVSLWAQSDLANTLRAFEDKPGYVQPIATSMGTLLNTGLVNSARVGKGIGWSFVLPVNIAYIGKKDHSYKYTYNTGCKELRQEIYDDMPDGYSCPKDDFTRSLTAPTLWGNDDLVYVEKYRINGPNEDDWHLRQVATLDKGHPTIRKFVTLPFVFPSFAFSMEHFRGSFRIIGVPSIKSIDFGGLLIWGLGGQYDFSHFIDPLNELGINISATTNFNFWSIGYSPTGEVEGELNLDGMTSFTGLVAGYKFSILEAFMELGYETSSFKTSGHLIDHGTLDDPSTPENESEIKPNIKVKGRNGIRASINLAVQLGVWRPVVGQSLGAQSGTQINILQFGKEGK